MTLEESVVRPYVSIDNWATVVDSRVYETILGADLSLTDVNLAEIIVGNSSEVGGTPSKLNVGYSSEVNL